LDTVGIIRTITAICATVYNSSVDCLIRLNIVFSIHNVIFCFLTFLLNFIVDYELFEEVVLGPSERDESVSFVSITTAPGL
jgi:hypothetical protein